MEAWVIKRDDGKYYFVGSPYNDGFVKSIIYAQTFGSEEDCKKYSERHPNCKPVKIRIEEVE